MTTCVYYDLEQVSPADIARGRSVAPNARELIVRGSAWPADAGGERPAEIESLKEFDPQQALMDWVDRLFAAIQQSPDGRALFRHGESSVLEILRFRFFLDFSAIEQRWQAVQEMAACSPDRIVWVAAPGPGLKFAETLARRFPIPLQIAATKRSSPAEFALRFARRVARRALDWADETATRLRQRGAAGDAAARIVFVEYFPNSAKVLAPVAEALRDRHGVDVSWIGTRNPVSRLLEGLGIKSLPVACAAPRTSRLKRRFGAGPRRRLAGVLGGLPPELFTAAGGANGKEHLIGPIGDLLAESAEESLYWLDAFSEAFERMRPRAVVSTSYSGIVGRASAVAAKRVGAASAYVQHGMFPDCDFYAHFVHDHLLLWGDANRRTMIRNDVHDERISVVGATIYDELAARLRSQPATRFPRPGEPMKIAYLASRTGGMVVNLSRARDCLQAVAEAVRQIPNARLEVKIHPGDKTSMVADVLGEYPGFTAIRDGSSQDVICRSDLAIVVSSTTGLEACMADKPLVELQLAGVPNFGPYKAYGAAIEVDFDTADAAGALAAAVRSLSSEPAKLEALAAGRRRLVDDLLNGGRGNATELAADAIADLAHVDERAGSKLTVTK